MRQNPKTPVKRQLTADEYHRMADAGILARDERVELINGEIIKMTPIGHDHAGCVNYLSSVYSKAVQGTAIIAVQNPLALGEYSELQPDLAVLKQRDDFYRSQHPVANDVLLVIEVADTSLTHDQSVKIPLYSSHNIPEAWIIDLGGSQLIRYRDPGSSGYDSLDIVSDLRSVRIDSEKDLSVDLTQLFG